ncbi:hypothetical protein, conserved [Eimeria brunetti]|uniref:Replication termination factor 2 n=1 Tax=Eimeria brunetti TaxID=51314 RepID=U6LH05_9EIME|nr:hypothetical protein, conserved [Eimeria brunetti]
MGGDGGSFSHRTEMVRTKGFKFLRNLGGMGYTPNTQIRMADERFGKNESRDLRSSACAYSQEKLQPPLLACRIGRLYNKEAVIKALLDKTLPAHMKHIKTLKDMKELKVEINPKTGFPMCPITNADFSSGVRGSIVWPCGFILANRALEAMAKQDKEGSKSDSSSSSSSNSSSSNSSSSSSSSWESGRARVSGVFVCPMCSKAHEAATDLIPLSPDEEESNLLLQQALQQQQAKLAARKKSKTAAAAAAAAATATGTAAATAEAAAAGSPAAEGGGSPAAAAAETAAATPTPTPAAAVAAAAASSAAKEAAEKEQQQNATNKRKSENKELLLQSAKRAKDWVLGAETESQTLNPSSAKQRKVITA